MLSPKTAVSVSLLIFGVLVVAQAWVLGENPGVLRLLGSVAGWLMFSVATGGVIAAVTYIFDITDPAKLKRNFALGTLVMTGLFALWLIVALTSDAPPPFLGPPPPQITP